MTDLQHWDAHGPVRTLRREFAEWDAGRDRWQTPRGFTIVSFRPDGQVAECTTHNPDRSVAREVWIYDDHGRLIESQFSIDDGPRTHWFYTYDSQSRLTAKREVGPDGVSRHTETARYDDAGRKTVTRVLPKLAKGSMEVGFEGTDTSYGAPGAVTLSIVYNERQLPVEAKFFGASERLLRGIVFSRDADGRLVSEVATFVEDDAFASNPALNTIFKEQILLHVTYDYDTRGRLRHRLRRMGPFSEESTSFEYDDHDNETVVENSERRANIIEIDDNGVPRARDEQRESYQQRSEYLYDAYGNWVERVVLTRADSEAEFHRSSIERRAISYYELP